MSYNVIIEDVAEEEDEALSAVGNRLQAALRGAGVSVEDLIAAAAEARAEIVQAEFGDEANQ